MASSVLPTMRHNPLKSLSPPPAPPGERIDLPVDIVDDDAKGENIQSMDNPVPPTPSKEAPCRTAFFSLGGAKKIRSDSGLVKEEEG